MKRGRFAVSAIVVLAGMMLLGTNATAQILQIGELNTQQIRALDLGKTVILIPGDILEEHGPYLPSFTDGYGDDAFTQALAKAIVAKPGWTVVVFPQIPLGSQPMNRIGDKASFPGSYPVRLATLRAVYMDLATELGEAGFRWIFLVHNHGAPNHHKALGQASDYFHDAYGGTMVDLFGLVPIYRCCRSEEKILTAAQLAENGYSIHAGADEQSRILFLKPQLVPEGYKSAPSLTGSNFADLIRITKSEGWPGYYGAPRFATAALGAVEFKSSSENLNTIALQILSGMDPMKIARWADEQSAELKYDEAIEKREMDWLKKNKIGY
jgi:creatinine amidohydrolase/Fe(II)-dependent formamide hydrolase-like protein